MLSIFLSQPNRQTSCPLVVLYLINTLFIRTWYYSMWSSISHLSISNVFNMQLVTFAWFHCYYYLRPSLHLIKSAFFLFDSILEEVQAKMLLLTQNNNNKNHYFMFPTKKTESKGEETLDGRVEYTAQQNREIIKGEEVSVMIGNWAEKESSQRHRIGGLREIQRLKAVGSSPFQVNTLSALSFILLQMTGRTANFPILSHINFHFYCHSPFTIVRLSYQPLSTLSDD